MIPLATRPLSSAFEAAQQLPSAFEIIHNDFNGYASADAANLTTTTGDSGTAAVIASTSGLNGGVLKLLSGTSTGTAEDQLAVAATVKQLVLTNGKRMSFRCRLKWTNTTANQNAIVVGLIAGYTADQLLSDSTTLYASLANSLMFYKLGLGTVWNVVAAKAAGVKNAQTSILAETATATVSASITGQTTAALQIGNMLWQEFGIDFDGGATVDFLVNGDIVATENTAAKTYLPAIASATAAGTALGPVFYRQISTSTANDPLYVDDYGLVVEK